MRIRREQGYIETASQSRPIHHHQLSATVQDAASFDAYVRQAARNMIQQAIDLEVQEFLDAHAGRVDAQDRRYVVRNGQLPEGRFLVPAGRVQVRQPRVRDTSPNREIGSS